jgi:hypothetical protein
MRASRAQIPYKGAHNATAARILYAVYLTINHAIGRTLIVNPLGLLSF